MKLRRGLIVGATAAVALIIASFTCQGRSIKFLGKSSAGAYPNIPQFPTNPTQYTASCSPRPVLRLPARPRKEKERGASRRDERLALKIRFQQTA